MNMGMLAGLILALLIFTVTVAALMFYVRHWASRQTQRINDTQLTEGRLLKRYIPPPLRPSYDHKRAKLHHGKGIQRRAIARVLYVVIGVGALVLYGGALDVNSDKLLQPIDLSPEDIQRLTTIEASWSPLPEHGLPTMKQRLALLRNRGVAVVTSPADEGQVLQGQRLTALAKSHWQNLFSRWEIPAGHCNWHELTACLSGRIGIVLPGNWQLDEMDRALNNGASLLVYGPPSSVLTKHAPFQWHGLTFKPFSNGTPRHLALRGDQVLTLGFDAGLILDADRAFKGYRVFSDLPQAIGISSDRVVGGPIDTRIYAKGFGKGRLVWMDYAPDEINQALNIDVHDLEAITAAIFRYLLGETYSSWATWPEGKRFAGMLSEDSEDKFRFAKSITDLVRIHDFPITWFMLSSEAQRNRNLTRQMAEVGEVACHGDNHASFPRDSLDRQVERLARCRKVLQVLTGQTPGGFRPPREAFNGDTISAVASLGMSYYFADAGIDRVVPMIMRENDGTRELVSLPRMGADDYEMWHSLKLNGEQSLLLAEDQLKWVQTAGGFLPFDFHTQFMDKMEYVSVVEHYGRRFKQPDCFFGTASQISNWWRARSALMHGKPLTREVAEKYQPVRLAVDAHGQLTREQAEPLL